MTVAPRCRSSSAAVSAARVSSASGAPCRRSSASAFLRRRRAGFDPVIEREAVGTDVVAEVVGVEAGGREVDELPIVRRRQRDVRGPAVVTAEELQEYRLSRGDALDGVGAAEQLVEQEEMRPGAVARPDQLEEGVDFRDVVALAAQQIVGTADAAADVKDRRTVLARAARVNRLREYRVHADGAQERRLAGHVRAGHEHPAASGQHDRVGHGVLDERVTQLAHHCGPAGRTEVGAAPLLATCPERRHADRGVDVADGGRDPDQRVAVAGEIADPEVDAGAVEQQREIEKLVDQHHDVADGDRQRVRADREHERVAVHPPRDQLHPRQVRERRRRAAGRSDRRRRRSGTAATRRSQ